MQMKMDQIVKTRILMVCLGNICRSPLAQGIMEHMISSHGLQEFFEVDSAGTSGLTGENPDPRSQEVAQRKGIILQHKARKLLRRDFKLFDHILVMDEKNLANTLAMARDEEERRKVKLITSFDPRPHSPRIVVDPYWGELKDFLDVFEQLHHCCQGWIKNYHQKAG